MYQILKKWVVLQLARSLPTCIDVTRTISDSLDRQLPLRQRLGLKMHLLICVWCERYKQQLLFIREAMQKASRYSDEREFPPATSLSTEARQRIKRALTNQQQ